MFVITADQIGSRTDIDRVPDTIDWLAGDFGADLLLPPGRNAGDEVQLITDQAPIALAIALELTRTGYWSVGLGVGPVRTPLPGSIGEAAGGAFIAARRAVDRAKQAPLHFALSAHPERAAPSTTGVDDGQLEALINLLLVVRARRSPEGWAAVDLVTSGLNQRDVAGRLAITPQAVSSRLQAAHKRLEDAALPGIVVLLQGLAASAEQGGFA